MQLQLCTALGRSTVYVCCLQLLPSPFGSIEEASTRINGTVYWKPPISEICRKHCITTVDLKPENFFFCFANEKGSAYFKAVEICWLILWSWQECEALKIHMHHELLKQPIVVSNLTPVVF